MRTLSLSLLLSSLPALATLTSCATTEVVEDRLTEPTAITALTLGAVTFPAKAASGDEQERAAAAADEAAWERRFRAAFAECAADLGFGADGGGGTGATRVDVAF